MNKCNFLGVILGHYNDSYYYSLGKCIDGKCKVDYHQSGGGRECPSVGCPICSNDDTWEKYASEHFLNIWDLAIQSITNKMNY